MKTPSPKNQPAQKIIFLFLFFVFLFFLLNLFYNRGRSSDILITDRAQGVLAAEEEKPEEEEPGRLLCGKEIPVGEAMEKTAGLLKAIITELEAIETNLIFQIKAAEEITKLAEQCNVANCRPVCQKVPYPYQGAEVCFPQNCSGQLCPNTGEIAALSSQIADYYSKIAASKKRIDELIERKTPPGEEIAGLPISTREEIMEDLYRSREEFDKCYIPPADWEKVARGEKRGKILWSCEIVMDEDLPRETKTTEEGVPVCTSFHNWFCCY